jgi:hypothetical protein
MAISDHATLYTSITANSTKIEEDEQSAVDLSGGDDPTPYSKSIIQTYLAEGDTLTLKAKGNHQNTSGNWNIVHFSYTIQLRYLGRSDPLNDKSIYL